MRVAAASGLVLEPPMPDQERISKNEYKNLYRCYKGLSKDSERGVSIAPVNVILRSTVFAISFTIGLSRVDENMQQNSFYLGSTCK